MNENPANDYYPKDFFQSKKKEEQRSASSSFESIVAMLSATNPLLSSLINGKSIDQKSLIQAISSLNQNTNSKTEINSFDANYCEEL